MNKKLLSKTELEKPIKDDDQSVKLVQKKKTVKSSECRDFFNLFLFTIIKKLTDELKSSHITLFTTINSILLWKNRFDH